MLQHFLRAANNTQNITYVGGYVQGYAGTTSDIVVSLTSLTGGVNTQPSANDLVIVCFGTGSTADTNLVVAGYTELTELYANSTFDTNFVAAYKFMSSTPDTSVTLTGGTLNLAYAGTVYVSVWRGVAGFDVASVTNTQSATFLVNPGTITPVTFGSIVLACGVGAYQGTTGTYSSPDLTGDFKSVASSDTNCCTIGGGYAQWTTGAFNPSPFTSTISPAGASAASVTMALKPGVKTIQYIDSTFSTQAANTSTNFPVTTPTGAIWGDYLLCFIAAGTRTVATPSGWTLLNSIIDGVNNNYAFGLSLTSAPAASYTFVLSNALVAPTGIMVAYRNQSGTPITATSSNTGTSMLAPAIINSEIGLVATHFSQGAGITITTPTNMTQRENAQSSAGSRTSAMSDKLVVGNFDAVSATASASGTNNCISVKLI